MIDERIVELAREFHELGGTEGIENHFSGYVIIWYNGSDELYTDIIRTFILDDDKQIPILDESELWAWLWKWGYYKVNRDFKGYYLQRYSNHPIGGWEVVDVDIKADNLHVALYVAAVWVAKEKHDRHI